MANELSACFASGFAALVTGIGLASATSGSARAILYAGSCKVIRSPQNRVLRIDAMTPWLGGCAPWSKEERGRRARRLATMTRHRAEIEEIGGPEASRCFALVFDALQLVGVRCLEHAAEV